MGLERRRFGFWFGGVAALVLGATGCGHIHYAIYSSPAASKLEEARELGAEEFAPYEYYSAKAHWEKAQHEAAEADYSDAADLAETAEKFAIKAIKITRITRQGAGR